MPAQANGGLKDAVKRHGERRQARRAQFAAQGDDVRNLAYILLPQTRKHLGKLIEKERKDVLGVLKLIKSTPDADSKNKLNKRLLSEVSNLFGLVQADAAKKSREAGSFVVPTVAPLGPTAIPRARVALSVPVNFIQPSHEAVVIMARMLAAATPRRKNDTGATAFVKLRALVQRGLARMVEFAKISAPEVAMSQAILETLRDDPLVIAQEVAAGGLRADPAADLMAPLVAPVNEDLAVAVEDLMRPQPPAPLTAQQITKLLRDAKAVVTETAQISESPGDEIIQDVTLAQVPVATVDATEKASVTDEDFKPYRPGMDSSEAVPFYQQPVFLVTAVGVGGLLAYYFYHRKESAA